MFGKATTAISLLLVIVGALPIVSAGSSKGWGKCPPYASSTPVTDSCHCRVDREKCTSSPDADITFKSGPSTCTPSGSEIFFGDSRLLSHSSPIEQRLTLHNRGESVTIEVQLTAKHATETRYDYSMWVPNTLGYSDDTPFKGVSCDVTIFPCQDGGDGDYCGDLLGASAYRRQLGRRKGGNDDEDDDSYDDEDDDSYDDEDDDSDGSEEDDSEDDDSKDDDSEDNNSEDDDSEDDDENDDEDDDGSGNGDSPNETTFDGLQVTVPCRAGDDGYLVLPVCLSWDNDDSSTCAEPYDALSDECGCEIIVIEDVGVCKPNDEECYGPLDESCCHVCVEETYGSEHYICADEGASGDPHLVGFRGQKFDFTGTDGGYYALLAQDDPLALVTMRLQAPVPGLDVIMYIVGFGIKAADLNGEVHTVEAFVENPEDFYAHRECPKPDEPCLAQGALTVLLDDEVVTRPGTYELGPGFEVGAVNLPGQCRSFGFEKYWARKVREANEAAAVTTGAASGRRLESWAVPMEEWILGDSKMTNRVECEAYVARRASEGGLFDFQSEYVSFQISTPALTVRVNHGKLHQLAMRDPTDKFDLPDHRTFQQNIAFERAVLDARPRGIMGETVRPTRDAVGRPITHGIGAMHGTEEDYRVSGPLSDDFAMGEERSSGSVAIAEPLAGSES